MYMHRIDRGNEALVSLSCLSSPRFIADRAKEAQAKWRKKDLRDRSLANLIDVALHWNTMMRFFSSYYC